MANGGFDRFPTVNWDVLGELPDLMEQARGRRTRQSLSDIDMSSPSGMRKAADQLWKSGNLQNMEQASRLYTAALGREESLRRAAADQNYIRALPGILERTRGIPGPGGPATQAPGEEIDLFTPSTPGPQSAAPARARMASASPVSEMPVETPAPPVAAPDPPPSISRPVQRPPEPSQDTFQQRLGPFDPLGSMIEQQRQDQINRGVPVRPGQRIMDPRGLGGDVRRVQAPETSEQVLAAAETPVPEAPAQTRVAQAGPGPVPGVPDPRARAREEARILANELMRLPKGAPSSAVNSLTARLRNSLGQLELSKEEKEYNLDMIERQRFGEPVVSRRVWRMEEKTGPDEYKDTRKVFIEGYRKEGKNAESLLQTIGQMEAIVRHPAFVSGQGTALVARGISGIAALRDAARAIGVSDATIQGIAKRLGVPDGDLGKLTVPAQLSEAFTALSNEAIFAKLGTLGNQISEGDRNFIQAAFPSLRLTKEGNILLLKIMKETAERGVANSKAAEDYMADKGVQATVVGLDRAVRRIAESSSLFADKNGRLTERGELLKRQIDEAQGIANPPPVSYTPGNEE